MQRKHLILLAIILIYLPVMVDATVLHLAIPTLSRELNFTANEMLWVIDIYSIVMASFILPMGALGDRIGYKNQLIIGAIVFGLGSLVAGLASTVPVLIVARAFLGLGAAIILPATLSGIRHTFTQEKERNFALGIWGAAGAGGGAFGPLLGGYVLEHFQWGVIFLMNVPIVLLVLGLIVYLMPKQAVRKSQALQLGQAVILVMAILSLVFALKSLFAGLSLSVLVSFLLGLGLLAYFIRYQSQSPNPMIDLELFKQPIVSSCMVLTLFALFAVVGFELLLAQELQFVYGYAPLAAGLYILPFMLSVSLSGPVISLLSNRFPLRALATIGLILCGISFIVLAQTHFIEQRWQAWFCMVLLGFGIELALLSSTSALMSTVPSHKATAAGAISGMAYELGTGLGIALFGLLLSYFYRHAIDVPPALSQALSPLLSQQATNSIAEAFTVAQGLAQPLSQELELVASQAFTQAHSMVLWICAGLYLLLAAYIWRALKPQAKPRAIH